MSEQQLKDFGTRAETLVEIPDFAELERQGHGLRVRRRMSVAAVLVAVLTVAGVTATQTHKTYADRGRLKPPPSSGPNPYPAATMGTLSHGRYVVRPGWTA